MTGVPGGNYTSIKDTTNIVSDLYNSKLTYSQNLLNLMKQQTRKNKLPMGVPSGITTGNKTGELGNSENDTMIVYLPNKPYVLSVMTTNLTNNSVGIKVIRGISSLVFNYVNG